LNDVIERLQPLAHFYIAQLLNRFRFAGHCVGPFSIGWLSG
jgi:hypothetical protein